MDYGGKIASLREKLNMTQSDLAEKLFVSRDLVSKWETGTRRPSYDMLCKAAEIFGVNIDQLVEKSDVVLSELNGCVPDGLDVDTGALTGYLNSFLRTLKGNDAGLFLRRYYYLESTKDVSTFFGIKENAARSRLSRIRKKLYKYLKENVNEGQ